MQNNSIIEIAARTDGDIYVGVVGPVRTGKSTFIKKFMESMVIPNIENVYKKERAKDELPQSGSGKTIMTTEPKFIPEEAAQISLDNNTSCKVRLVDCVGYMVNSALGHIEDDKPRMVTTPWDDAPIEMRLAAEIGTKKVINEHSTIGLVITTDGSITDIDREDYIEAETRVIEELIAIGKPFAIIVNSKNPNGEDARAIAQNLSNKYSVSSTAINCMNISEIEIREIMQSVLYEFPLGEVAVNLPKWINSLPKGHQVKTDIYSGIYKTFSDVSKMRDISAAINKISEIENVSASRADGINLGTGNVRLNVELNSDVFYKIIEEQTGLSVRDEADLMPTLLNLAKIKTEYERLDGALNQVRQTGYGIVMPSINELTLEEPEIVKHGGKFGVKLKASAPSIHMIRADIETEVSPIVGSEKQSEELVHYLLSEFDTEPGRIWESNIFGKSLHELVSEGLNNKLNRMPDDARDKIRETLSKIINEGSGGLICIIL